MKNLWRLTAWNWYIVRKSWLFVCTILAAVELAVLLFTANSGIVLGFGYDTIFVNSFAPFIFVAGYLAAMGVSLRPLLQAQGKNKGSYTLQTLPIKRGTVLASHMLCTAITLCGIAVWQLVLTAVFYWPTMAVANAAALRAWPTYTPPAADMQLAYLRNTLVRFIIPTDVFSALVTILLVLAPSVLLVAAFYHRGKARLAAFVMGFCGAGCCGVLAVASLRYRNENYILSAAAVLLGLMLAAVLWALRSIRRSTWL